MVSQGLLDVLDDQELCAVIEHEHAHLRLHHHEIMAVLQAIAQPLRVVPLVRAVQDAIPSIDLGMIGLILMGAGALSLVLSLIINQQRRHTRHDAIIEHHDTTPPR